MDNRICDLFKNFKLRNVAMEVTDIAIATYLVEQKGYEAIVYGAGKIGMVAARYIKDNLKLIPRYIIDEQPGEKEIENIPVVNLHEGNDSLGKMVCFIATKSFYKEEERKKIITYLNARSEVLIVDIIPVVLDLVKVDFYSYFVRNKDKFIEQYECFEDDISRETYYAYIKAHLEGDIYRGKEYEEVDKYFGTSQTQSIYELEDGITWINLGSFRGDTIYNYVNKKEFVSFECILAIEGSKENVAVLKNNISFLEKKIRDKIVIINEFCGNGEGNVKLDDLVGNQKVGLVNMDIEGAELGAIESAEIIIKRDRPVLAICMYHKPSDLLVILDKIKELTTEYSFFLRKYTSGIGRHWNAVYRTNELVLYAVPKERVVYWK